MELFLVDLIKGHNNTYNEKRQTYVHVKPHGAKKFHFILNQLELLQLE